MGVFNKTIIPLALVGYEMITANSYPTRTLGIIVKYSTAYYTESVPFDFSCKYYEIYIFLFFVIRYLHVISFLTVFIEY